MDNEKKWTLKLDGKKWSGPIEKGIEGANIFTKNPRNENELLGFKNDKLLLKWAEKEGMLEQYERLVQEDRILKYITPPETEGEEEELLEIQMKTVEKMTKRFRKTLQERKIDPHDVEKIMKLKEEDFHSVILYDNKYYRGSLRYLPGGRYPSLKLFGFNDKAESAIAISLTILCEHSWYRGKRLYVWGTDADLGWFNNRISSVVSSIV